VCFSHSRFSMDGYIKSAKISDLRKHFKGSHQQHYGRFKPRGTGGEFFAAGLSRWCQVTSLTCPADSQSINGWQIGTTSEAYLDFLAAFSCFFLLVFCSLTLSFTLQSKPCLFSLSLLFTTSLLIIPPTSSSYMFTWNYFICRRQFF
jgi:hypothetical protein